ncbi:DUF2887 domain-containing protein [Methylomagnum sp.]
MNQYPTAAPWYVVVIYSSPAAECLSAMCAPFLSLSNLRRIYLSELPLLDSANPKFWLLALIGAEFGQIPAIVDKVQAHRTHYPDDGVDWLDLLETILVYKLPKFTRKEIQDMFGFTDIELKQTKFYQEAFAEGEFKGQAKGEAALLLRLLERKFPSLPETARQRIANADAETLLVWGERVLDAARLEDIWEH